MDDSTLTVVIIAGIMLVIMAILFIRNANGNGGYLNPFTLVDDVKKQLLAVENQLALKKWIGLHFEMDGVQFQIINVDSNPRYPVIATNLNTGGQQRFAPESIAPYV